jgi:hypothetical protein
MDEWMNMKHWWNDNWQENTEVLGEKPNVTLSTINPTQTDLQWDADNQPPEPLPGIQPTETEYVKSEILTAVNMVFWDVTLCKVFALLGYCAVLICS